MLRDGAETVRNFIRPTGRSISDKRNLKYCSACANEQWNLYNRSTWLISHQLPCVEVCYKHGLALINSGVSTSRLGLHFNPITLPPFTEHLQAEQVIGSAGEPWDKTSPNRLIAQISHELLTWQPVSGNKGRVYKAAFISAGLGSGEAGNWDNIGSLLRVLYGDLIPRRLGITFKCDSYEDWIHLITRAKICVHNPILHILIIGAMFEHLDEFERALIEDTKQYVHCNLSKQPADCLLLAKSTVLSNDQQLLEEKRQTIIKKLTADPHLSRTELKRIIPRCYNWLLRNDNEWMQSILPSKAIKTIRGNSLKTIKPPSGIDWASLDQMLASELYEIPSEQAFARKSNGELVVNLAAISRITKLTYHRVKTLSSYPHSSAAINRIKDKIQHSMTLFDPSREHNT